MNKSQRIYLNPDDTGESENDKYIKVRLEQDTDTLEFMSLSLGTKDVYQNFNSDYGVLIGRVIANGNIGIENARISVFIPLSDEDAEDEDIYSVYPYKTPRDKNIEGKRYNLLPRVSKINETTGESVPKQPFGSFPIKEEILGNEPFLKVYKKYYKYTALTNSAGDYMIMGLPTGTQTIHLSVDITDIGDNSMNPAAMITNLGYSPNLFDDNGTSIKESNDLNDLPNIETQEITVDINPFWGDIENFEIGITRQDFRIRATLIKTFIIFGSVYTDEYESGWGTQGRNVSRSYQMRGDVGIKGKKSGNVTEKIYYYPANITDEEIDSGDYVDKMELLGESEYSSYKNGGDFVFIINCNRDKIIYNNDGTNVSVENEYVGGLFTTFRGFMTLEIDENDLSLDWKYDDVNDVYTVPVRQKIKFPQNAYYKTWGTAEFHSFRNPNDSSGDAEEDNANWREQHYKFTGGEIYSIAKFHNTVYNNSTDVDDYTSGYIEGDKFNNVTCNENNNTGVIIVSDVTDNDNNNETRIYNSYYNMPSNGVNDNQHDVFGANWMNLSVYLPQTHWACKGYSFIEGDLNNRTNSQFQYNSRSTYYVTDNTQQIAGPYTNTCSFARSDLNWTDFVVVSKEDIINLNDVDVNGFKTDDNGTTYNNITLTGNYRNGTRTPTDQVLGWSKPTPTGGGRCGGAASGEFDGRTYFYMGHDESNVIKYINDLGII